MTNREWLESLSDSELAEFLTCGLYVHSLYPCEGNVPISQDYVVSLRMVTGRYTQSHLGLAEWLKSEQEYEVIKEENELKPCPLTMEYKGYVGSVELSKGDSLFFGKVLGIRALISYEGKTMDALVKDFHNAIDDYLAWEMDGQEGE